jgi:hypothetical protein
MSLNMLHRLRRVCRASGCVGMALIAAGCGGDSGTPTPSSTVRVVDAASVVVPPSAPTATPTPTIPTAAPGDLTTTGVIVQSGDSIGVGLGADNWAAIDHLGFANSVVIHNVSVSGIAMQAGYGRRVSDVFGFYSTKGPSILVIQQGTNDIYYGTKAEALYKSILIPFVSSAQAAGFYVVVDSILPRADSGWTATMEQQRVTYNTFVRGNGARADAINDIAADPLMGDGTNPATSAYYADGLHPTLIGQQRLVTLNAAVLAPFLERPTRLAQR